MSQDNSALLPVPFRNATLFLVEHNERPYVPLRPIVEALGLSWASQTVKVNSDKIRWGVSMIETPADKQPMLCLPLTKLGGWLMTISVNKVKPELRETIRAYQAECDDALWSYWTQGHATRPQAAAPRSIPLDDHRDPRVNAALPPPPDPLAHPDVRKAINRKAHALSAAAFEHHRAAIEGHLRRAGDLTDPEAVIARLHALDLDHSPPPVHPAFAAPAPRWPAGRTRLLAVIDNGRLVAADPLADDALALTPAEWIGALASPDFPKRLLPAVLKAVSARMQERLV